MKSFNFKILYRRTALVVYDIISIIASAYLALLIRYELSFNAVPMHFRHPVERFLPFNIVLTVLLSCLFRLYNSLWAYAGETELQSIVISSVLSGAVNLIGLQFFKESSLAVPKSYYFLYVFLLIAFVFVSRFSYRFLRNLKHKSNNRNNDISVMVIGAGEAANVIIKEIINSNFSTMKIRCIIDDDRGKWGKYIQGIRVVGGRDKIIECADTYEIDQIIVAVPSISRRELREILEICKETECKIQSLPGMYQLVNGDVSVSKLRDIEIEDLLGRDPVEIDIDSILGYVQGKIVLVSGAGGSIGSELCRQIATHKPARLVMVDIYENSIYEIQQELKLKNPELELSVLIASVRNANRMNWIFDKYHPDIVYHAAAHKHVPLMEDSPGEAIKNNVFGTFNVAQSAAMSGAHRFVLISTDKAVNPTNIMGASKRICEMIIQTFNNKYDTEFVAVRFGNVLGSNGSVIPLFRRQIAEGGPVTVTHPDIIRYFMTIPEAVTLVLQAGAYAKGGEIFVLDMGEPVKILDLAENLIRLSGYKPYEEIEIKFTGLRPGEKLFEEMLMDEEGLKETANSMIHIGRPLEIDDTVFFEELKELKDLCEIEGHDIRPLVQKIVPTYVYGAEALAAENGNQPETGEKIRR